MEPTGSAKMERGVNSNTAAEPAAIRITSPASARWCRSPELRGSVRSIAVQAKVAARRRAKTVAHLPVVGAWRLTANCRCAAETLSPRTIAIALPGCVRADNSNGETRTLRGAASPISMPAASGSRRGSITIGVSTPASTSANNTEASAGKPGAFRGDDCGKPRILGQSCASNEDHRTLGISWTALRRADTWQPVCRCCR